MSNTQEDEPRLTRLNVSVNQETADVVKEYTARKGVTLTETVRRAVAALAFIDQTQRQGTPVYVKENDSFKAVMFLI